MRVTGCWRVDELAGAGDQADGAHAAVEGVDGAVDLEGELRDAVAEGGINVTFNVTTPDLESFRRSETQLAALLARAVAQGQRNL